jgi:hypothetical protein
MLGIGMNGVAMTTKSSDADAAVFKFLQPGFRLGAVGDEFVQRAMWIVRIATRADLHGFQAERGDFVQHGVEGEVVVNRIEHSDGNLAHVAGRLRGGRAWERRWRLRG